MILGAISFAGTGKKLKILTIDGSKRTADVAKTAEMAAMGKLRINIDSIYPLERLPEAMRYMMNGHIKGKIVIEIAEKDSL